MNYARPAGASRFDREAAREFENTVGDWLGPYKIAHLDATDRMDFWVPGVYIDVKEKRQPLSNQWTIPSNSRREDVFVLDELSIRRAMQYHPHAYFLLRDVPLDRIFLARLDEVLAGDHTRCDRIGKTGHRKGKWLIVLTQFRQLQDPATELLPTILRDQVDTPWKRSELLIPEAA